MTDRQHLDLLDQMMTTRAAMLSTLAMLEKWYEEHGLKVDGMTPGEWFSTYMPSFLDRELQSIREADPALAERLANHLRQRRGPVSPV